MSSVESILKSAQPGLMLMPTHGIFVTAWLAKPHSSKPVLSALKRLVSDAETAPGRRGLVVAINGALWGQWSGQVPAGAPPAQPLLASSSQERSINPGGGKSGDPKVGGQRVAPPPGFG